MKKMKLSIWLLIMTMFASACGVGVNTPPVETETPPASTEVVIPTPSQVDPDSPSESENESIDIRITIGETVVTATLDNSETSRDFAELLPLTLDMTRFYDREYAGSLRPASLSQNGETIDDFENGDVTYYVAGNALAIFFDKADRYDQSGLIRMGKITSGLDALIQMQGDEQMVITLAEGNEETDMVEYDFSVFTNVEISGVELSGMTHEQQSVLYQQARYCQAMTKQDTDTMREIVSEDMVFTHMSGRQQSREEYFADVENGSLRYFTIGIETPVVEVDGDMASVHYTSVLNANAYGDRGTYRITGTHWYELRDGDWIAVNQPNT